MHKANEEGVGTFYASFSFPTAISDRYAAGKIEEKQEIKDFFIMLQSSEINIQTHICNISSRLSGPDILKGFST